VTRGPGLVATDLDGTLVHSDGSVTAYTREVLARHDERGVPVVFVTGRPLRWARDVFEHVGSHGLAVCANGALVWDVAGDAVFLERPIPVEVAREVAERIRAAVPGSLFAVENSAGLGLEPGYVVRRPAPETRVAALDDLLERPPLKLLARHEELTPEDYWARAEEVVGDLVTITWSSVGTLLEISAAGVTKASTLALLCDRLGVDAADVWAFGDMPNDLPMLTWAGTAYAMANAHPTVVACADHLAPSNDDDGVARVLAGALEA